MMKFGFKAAGFVAMGALMSCGGGPSSQLANTKWSSTTVNSAAMADNVMSITFAQQFGVPTTTTTTDATGPYTSTTTTQWNATGNNAGCHEVTMLTGYNYDDTFSQTDDTMGSVDISGTATLAVTRTGCMDTTQNGTFTSSLTSLPNGGGSNTYAITGGNMMTYSASDSAVPYDGMWTFMKVTM